VVIDVRRKLRKSRIGLAALVAALVAFTIVTVLPAASAKTSEESIEVSSSEAVIVDTTYKGDIENVRVVNFFELQGDGSTDITKELSLDDSGSWQGVKGLTEPDVEGDYLVWKGLDVDGNRNVLASTILGEEMVSEVRMRIPLDIEYIYEFNGKIVQDPNDITGQDGHFKLTLNMKNTSKEKTELEYEDPATGEMVTEEVETYLPLVILPYDWYFDNGVFFNLEADPTGVVVPLPEHYQVGWSIPLFPPASEDKNTIWVEADVKDFALPPLVLSANFIFPHTNQRDPVPEFLLGLEMMYDGVKQLNEGLGSAETEDTLLYGTSQVLDGMKQMAAGLPEAQTALNTQLIPGVDEAVAGLGTPGTPDTLMYAIDQSTIGLMQMVGGIGGTTVSDTLLYGIGAMSSGMEEMAAGIGSATTPDTLLYAVSGSADGLRQLKGGIGAANQPDTLLYGTNLIKEGLLEMKMGIGQPGTPDTLQYAMTAIADGLQQSLEGIGSESTPDTFLYAMAAMADGLNTMLDGIGSTSTPDTLLYGIDQVSKGISSGSASDPGILEGIEEIRDGLAEMYDATSTSGDIFVATNLIRILAPWTGPIVDQLEQGLILSTDPDNPSLHYGIELMLEGIDQLIGGIGSPSTPDTLLYGTAQIQGGLEEMKTGLGGATIPDTLLYAVAQVQGGLELMKAGIGDKDTNPSLLYGVDQVQQGLDQMYAGIGSSGNTNSLIGGVVQIEDGLKFIKNDVIGGADVDNTLLFAMDAMGDGLIQMKEGIGTATTADTLLYGAAQVEEGLKQMKEGIGAEGAPDSLLYAMAQVQHGLYLMKAGLSTGNMNDPGLKEGLILISAGLGDAVEGVGSTSTPDTLLYGIDQVNSGAMQVKDGTDQMLDGLATNLAMLYLTQAELEAIEIRGEEFDHILGRAEDAENGLAFIYQTPPTYNYEQGSKTSWLVAGIISLVLILALLALSRMRKRPVPG
jgi:putative membrane protein